MERLSKDALEKEVQEYFASSGDSKAYATEDGNVFGSNGHNAAQLHAKRNGLQVQTFLNENVATEAKEDLNAPLVDEEGTEKQTEGEPNPLADDVPPKTSKKTTSK